ASTQPEAARKRTPVPGTTPQDQVKTPPAPPAAKAPARAIGGQVLAADGTPVARADVAVLGWPLLVIRDRRVTEEMPLVLGQTRADDQGRFRLTIPDMPPKTPPFSRKRLTRFQVLATAAGHGPGWQGLSLTGDQNAVEVRLRQAQTIRGRVFDVQGQPVSGLRLPVVLLGEAERATDREIHVGLNYFDDGPGITPGFGMSGGG